MAKMFMKRGPLSKKNQVLAVPGLLSLHRSRCFSDLAVIGAESFGDGLITAYIFNVWWQIVGDFSVAPGLCT